MARVKGCDIWSCLPLRGDQGSPESDLQVQLVLGAIRGLWQGLEHLQSFCEVAHGFYMRRALVSAMTGPLPVGNRLLRQARLSMQQRHFRLAAHEGREAAGFRHVEATLRLTCLQHTIHLKWRSQAFEGV
jgi:hypothetical protein